MTMALNLAQQGEGHVEPNPMVGCVIVQNGQVIGQGYHHQFGADHAEVDALKQCKINPQGSTAYVTLEPCCHTGKTPPCSQALIDAQVAKVVIAQRDPFPKVAGGGISQLEDAGIEVEVGLLEAEAQHLNAPYLKLINTGMPWIIAKWAMTLDGKIASSTGDSQWISNEESRELVHQIRGRVDGIMVGSNTARLDDPRLTARPEGIRTAARIVIDSQATLSLKSKLVTTAKEIPMLIAVAETAPADKVTELKQAGCEIIVCQGKDHAARMLALLKELGQRKMTNLLVEGGSQILGTLQDIQQIDEVYAFIAPKIIGGLNATTPIAGNGFQQMQEAIKLESLSTIPLGDNILFHGRTSYSNV